MSNRVTSQREGGIVSPSVVTKLKEIQRLGPKENDCTSVKLKPLRLTHQYSYLKYIRNTKIKLKWQIIPSLG